MQRYNTAVDDSVALANFRYQIRRFLKMSEDAARGIGLEPQQHQLMLAVKALTAQGKGTPISVLAERLLLKHHSVVGLVDRLEQKGLMVRRPDAMDHRRVVLALTDQGEEALEKLSALHRRELAVLGPELIAALQEITRGISEAEATGGGAGY